MSKIKVKRAPVNREALAKALATKHAVSLVEILASPPATAFASGRLDPEDWLFWAGCVLLSAADAIQARRDARGEEP